MTTNARFITRRRSRSCSASLGSCIRVAPRMPPGAVSLGRFIRIGMVRCPADVSNLPLFAEYAKRRHCVWLDTASGDGRSLLAAEPAKIFRAKNERGVFERLHTELAGWPGYAIGYFGYDLKNEIERLPSCAIDDLGLPDCWFGFYENPVMFDQSVGARPALPLHLCLSFAECY